MHMFYNFSFVINAAIITASRDIAPPDPVTVSGRGAGRKDFIKGSRPPAIAWHWRAGLNSESMYGHCHSLKATIRL